MTQINVKQVIKGLQRSDRQFIEKAFFVLMPEAKKTRFKSVIARKDFDFSVIERHKLADLFTDQNGEWILNHDHKIINEIV